jgi:hypothetical protein
MTRNRTLTALSFLLLLSLGAGCEESLAPGGDGVVPGNPEAVRFDETVDEALAENSPDHEEPGDCAWEPDGATRITLGGDGITVDGAGVSVDGSRATIDTAGTYLISGTLDDGRIIVDTDGDGLVRLVLGGADITCSSNAPLSIAAAEKTVIVLEEGTDNHLTDAAVYVFDDPEDDEPNAALFSKDDLTICGGGMLSVSGNYNDGIAVKDGLVIRDAVIAVDAADDGIRGKDYLVIRGAHIVIDCGGDGLKSDNDSNASRGYIYIGSGAIDIECGGDAMQAETDVLISGGEYVLLPGGGSNAAVAEGGSAKGIKAGTAAIVDGGVFAFDCADDGINSKNSVVINGGSLAISSADDAVHADSTLGVNGGVIAIATCVEGLESSVLSITDGDIHIASSDDGINASKGETNFLYILGGRVAIDAGDDGIDSNGSILMTGGTVIIHAAPIDSCSTVDFDASFRMTGGFLLAAGSDGMVQVPDGASTQNSVVVRLGPMWAAGTLFDIQSDEDEELFTFAPRKPFGSILFSSPELTRGITYHIYYGGNSTGTEADGLYTGGEYTPGTELTSFTVTRTVTKVRGYVPEPPLSRF